MLRPLRQAQLRLPGQLQHLTSAGKHLAGHKERDQLLRHFPEIHVPPHQEVLMATVRVAQRIRIVLEDIDLS